MSRAVSSNRSNGPQLLDPVPTEELVGVVDPVTGEVIGGARVSDPGEGAPGAPAADEVRLVDTPLGPARATTTRPDGIPAGALVLGHGAGGLRWTLDVLATRDAAVAAGWVVVLVDQPWRVAGKKLGPAPASLDVAWLPMLAALDARPRPGPAGRGRPQRGCPRRVPHRRGRGGERGRRAVLPAAPAREAGGARGPPELAMPSAHGIPVHVVQGRTDPFGTPAEVEAVLPPGATLDVVTGAHSIGGSAPAVAALVVQRLPVG